MDQKAIGLVIRTRPYSNTSLIVHWLTWEYGRVATIAKGARSAKSSLRGRLELFQRAAISYAPSKRSDLHTLREASTLDRFNIFRTDIQALRLAGYATRSIESLTEVETPLPELCAIFWETLIGLEAKRPQSVILLAFEFKIYNTLGLYAPANDDRLSESLGQWIEYFVTRDLKTLSETELPEGLEWAMNQISHRIALSILSQKELKTRNQLAIDLFKAET